MGFSSSRLAGWRGAVAACILIAGTIDLTTLSRSAHIHVDEAWMINRGFLAGPLYRQYLKTGVVPEAWNSWVWQPRKPPLGNVVIGLGLWLGGAAAPERPYRYDWRHSYEWNLEHRSQVNLPPEDVLRAARTLIPLFASAATAAVFLLGAGAGGMPGGLLAASLFQLNPVVRHHGSHALSDMVMMAFSLWAIWFLARRVAPAWDGPLGRLLLRCTLFGCIAGLAIATKQNGALAACAGVAAVIVWGFSGSTRPGRPALGRSLLAILALGAGASGIFVAANPELHAAPFERSTKHVAAWKAKFEEHQERRPDQALTSLRAKALAVGRVLAGRSFGTLPYPALSALIVCAGFVLLALAPRTQPGGRGISMVILIWAAVTVALVTIWIPLDWDRYYLPIIAVGSVLSGGLGRLVPWLR